MPISHSTFRRPFQHRLLHVDALKLIAAQLIVLHHLAAYGPVADAVQGLLPDLIGGLYHYGRMAVQVFLVVGGFLSARALSSRGQVLQGSVRELLWRRYLRLAPPFMAAVLLTLLASAAVAPWLPELVPQSVSLAQLISHGLLLHGVLGHEALTVGAWYVAVDFQLFAALVLLLWLARGLGRAAMAPMVAALGLASMFIFNRMPELEAWAPYFFGSYSLGVLVHALSLSRWRRPGLVLLSLVVMAALAVDFRERLLVAGLAALALAVFQLRHERLQRLPPRPPRFEISPRNSDWLVRGGTQSYSLFLVHFPVCLLVNAVFAHLELGESPSAGLLAMAAAWALSNIAARPFHRWIEAPSARIRIGLRWLPRFWARA